MPGRWNNITVEAYASGTTPIVDPRHELSRHSGLNFRTIYPGGLYADASFYIPKPVVDYWELQGAQRIVFRNDLRLCYEGYISNFEHQVQPDSQGVLVRTLGAWGHILMNWGIRKRWADNRLSDDIWEWVTGDTSIWTTAATASEKCVIDRNTRLRFTPKAEAWINGQYAAVRYTMPVGQTITRLKYSYALAEGSQAWEISAWRATNPASFTQMTATSGETYASGTTTVITSSGSGNIDVTLATPSRYVELRFYARANQTPSSDGTYYGEFTSLEVYSETSSINMEEIAKDVIAIVTDLNSETRFIFSAGTPLSLVPFIVDGFESAAEVLDRAASQGDGAYNRWAVYTVGSERAYQPDGKPLLVLSQYATTTNYEYTIRMDDPNLAAPFTIVEDYDEIANWIVVSYTDQAGRQQYRTPDDNSALKDDTSISTYGRRVKVISIPETSTATVAEANGQRYLAIYKNPQYRVTTPITVTGYIRGKGGLIYPTSEVRSGYRVRVEDYAQSKTGSGQGLTFVVTQTLYEDESETCQITTGVPDAPLMLRYAQMMERRTPTVRVPETTRTESRTITNKMLRKMGVTREQWWRMTPAQRRALRRKHGV